MLKTKDALPRTQKLALYGLVIAGLLIMASTVGFSANKPETIDATALGTGTQMGQQISIALNIYDYSTQADKQTLVQAFEKAKNQGLVDALSKMKPAGHIEITGTLGYDCSYIRMIPTATGRKIRFVTNRLLSIGEVYRDSRSTAYDLTAGEFDLNDTDKSKSTGVLYPAAEFEIDKQGELQINLIGNPWQLADVIDWKGTSGVN
ncbi:MAG TPA: hypothetical protein VGP19_04715 [Candidatus Acidoferrales bacterium]|jgi:hypothetical protein|nr:hypothetical protein [Candidatus Acidoferrales bacterium]